MFMFRGLVDYMYTLLIYLVNNNNNISHIVSHLLMFEVRCWFQELSLDQMTSITRLQMYKEALLLLG